MGDNRVNITRITRRQRQENDDKRDKALKKDKPTQRNDKKKILIVNERSLNKNLPSLKPPNFSCPAVSQQLNLRTPLLVWKSRQRTSTPNVATYFFSNSPVKWRLTKVVFPTPPSPTRINWTKKKFNNRQSSRRFEQ